MSIKTLLVDDERSLLKQAEIFLERINQEIDVSNVSSAEKALELIEEENFDVIVSDYQMPDKDGLEFLEELREEKDSDIPFIMFTGKGREEVAMNALNLGADRYLQKGGDSKSQYGVLADAIEQEIKQGSTEEVLELTKYSVDKATPEIYWITEEGKFTYVNETVVERLGYSKEELEGMYIWDVDPNHGQDIRGERWEKLKEKGTLKFESEHETKEGERYPVEIISQYIEHDGEEYEFAFARDITERKEAEEKLREAKKNYQELFEKSGDAFFIHEPETGEILNVNEKMCEMYGYEPEEIIGKTVEITNSGEEPYTLERAEELIQKAREEGAQTFEWHAKKKSGELFWVEVTLKVVEIIEDRRVLATVRDITERRETEEEIKYRENLERIITEISTELMNIEVEKIDERIDQALKKIGKFAGADRSYVFQFNEDLEKMDNTHEWCDEGIEPQKDRLQGLSSDTFPWWMEKLKNFENITIPKVPELPPEAEAEKETFQAQNIKSLVALPLTTDNSLIGFIGFDWVKKEEEWSEEIVDLLRIVGETIASALDRKELLEKLKRKERYLDHTPEFINVIDEKGEIKYQSSPSHGIEGLDPSKIMGSKGLEFVHPDDKEEIQEMFSKVLENPGEEYRTELRGETKDSWTWFEVRAINLLNDPEIDGIIVTARDIGERKEVEEELKRSRSLLKLSQRLSKVGGWEYDVEKDRFTWTEEVYRIYGVDKEEYDPNELNENLSFYSTEDREKIDEAFKNAIENGESYDLELRFNSANDEQLWVRTVGEPFVEDGQVTKILGNIMDITDRKEAEERIKENKNKIEKLHELSAELQTYGSEEDVYSLAVEAAEDILDFDICSFDAVERDMFVTKEISSNTPEEGSANRQIEEGGLDSKTYLNQESYMVNDLSSDKDAKPVKSEYKSAISVPIGEYGVFQAVSTEVDHFDEEDLKTAELLVSHVSQALERVQAKEKEEFLHSLLRHDVGNKNQIIKGYLELMRDHDIPDEVKEFVDKAERAAKDSREIIDKVRKLRKVEKEDKISEVYLSSVIDKVCSGHQNQLEERDINIDSSKCDCKVKGGELLEELLSNLIKNSIQHSECDEVRIDSQVKEDECIVTVEDDGAGISDEAKDKIFEKGFKAGESAGTGLGLYMVKEIANSYDGSVEVKDSELGGARFDVKLEKI